MYETKCPCRARGYMTDEKCDETDCNKCCPLAIIAAERKTKTRVIDANKLEQIFLDENKRLRDMLCEAVGEERDHIQAFAPTVEWARRTVHKAPTIDAVEVVRCKDCVHWYDGEEVCLKIYSDGEVSPYAWQFRKPEDFCSYGERRDSDG